MRRPDGLPKHTPSGARRVPYRRVDPMDTTLVPLREFQGARPDCPTGRGEARGRRHVELSAPTPPWAELAKGRGISSTSCRGASEVRDATIDNF